MDCCICSPMAAVFRPPRNTICQSCYEAARNINSFLLHDEERRREQGGEVAAAAAAPDPKKPPKSLEEVLKWMETRKEEEKEVKERLIFMGQSSVALRDGLHTDVLLLAGDGPPIPAHKAILATKSEILKTFLSSDECKAPAADTISLPELTHRQLLYLLRFLYSGEFPCSEISEADMYELLLASDKYNVRYLRGVCERRVLASLGPSNALDVLELSEMCADTETMRDRAMATVAGHAKEVVFSKRYEAFAANNPRLCAEITRMFVGKLLFNGGQSIFEATG